MLAASDRTAEGVEKNLGMKVQGFVASDYNGVIEALRANHVEVAYLGPFSYVLGTTVAPIEAFATAETAKAGHTFYHSQIIALKENSFNTLDDLKGKTFAFVDPSSTSGHLFPKAGLIQAGFDPDKHFGRVLFTGSHDSNALAVPTSGSTPRPSPTASTMPRLPRSWSIRKSPRRVALGPDPGIADRLAQESAGRPQGRDQDRVPELKDIPGPTRASSTASSRPTTRPTISSAIRPRCSIST